MLCAVPFLALACIGLIAIAAGFGLGFHPARLERRLRLLSLEHGDLVARLLNPLRLLLVYLEQVRDLLQQLPDQRRALPRCVTYSGRIVGA